MFVVATYDHVTIVVMATNLKLMVSKRRCREMPKCQKHFLCAACSDANITTDCGSKRIDPMLKLYVGRPLTITENIDVENKIANGAMATFKKLKLKNLMLKTDGRSVDCLWYQ